MAVTSTTPPPKKKTQAEREEERRLKALNKALKKQNNRTDLIASRMNKTKVDKPWSCLHVTLVREDYEAMRAIIAEDQITLQGLIRQMCTSFSQKDEDVMQFYEMLKNKIALNSTKVLKSGNAKQSRAGRQLQQTELTDEMLYRMIEIGEPEDDDTDEEDTGDEGDDEFDYFEIDNTTY